MIETTRVATGFDYELLLGADYFLKLFRDFFLRGRLPSRLNVGSLEVILESPRAVDIPLPSSSTDLRVTIPYVAGPVQGEAIINLKLVPSRARARIKIAVSYLGLDDSTVALITAIPGVDFAMVEEALRRALDTQYFLSAGRVPIGRIEGARVPFDGRYQAAYGLYVNKEYLSAPEGEPQDPDFARRGDNKHALSFLPEKQSFVIGMPGALFKRLQDNQWHNWARRDEDGSWYHPYIAGGEVQGKYFEFSITPTLNAIDIKTRLEKDEFIDAEVTVEIRVTIEIRKEKIVPVLQLTKFDADTGIVGDILGAFFGALLGALLGPLGAAFGAVGGIVAWEIGEDYIENGFEADFNENLQSDDEGGEESVKYLIMQLFRALPDKVFLGTSGAARPVRFTRHYNSHAYEAFTLDENGMAFEGDSKIELFSAPTDL